MEEGKALFVSLVTLIANACWQHLGKVPNPLTGKIERDLNSAKMSIDLLIMLKEKTKNNLTPEEEEFLSNTISNLQLNYVDEVEKEKKK